MVDQWNDEQENPPLSGGMIAGMIGLSVILPLLGPLIALVVGIISHKRPGALAIIIVACIVPCVIHPCIAAIGIPQFAKARETVWEAEVMAHASTIQLELERYNADTNSYPSKINDLITEGYLDSFPLNPFVHNEISMREIPFGDSDYHGNFTYVPIIIDGSVQHYYLLAYGSLFSHDWDYDGDGEEDYIILALSSRGEVLDPDGIPSKELQDALSNN